MFPFGRKKAANKRLDLDHLEAIFFDLDGTLIDVDMRRFVPVYLQRLTQRMQALADPDKATRVLHEAVAAMFGNQDAAKTLEKVLLEALEMGLGISAEQYQDCLATFAREDLDQLQTLVSGHPLSQCLVDQARARGWKVVLATNPIFPRRVIDARLAWGRLDGDTFHHVTAYETAHFCKPNPAYFVELLDHLKLSAERCLMVGNDTIHDLAAAQVGMQTCLLTPWRIRRAGSPFRADWQGRHEELLGLLENAACVRPERTGPD